MLGNLVAQTVGSRHAELDVLRPVIGAAWRPANAGICRIEGVAGAVLMRWFAVNKLR
jgi:hypothetical protein